MPGNRQRQRYKACHLELELDLDKAITPIDFDKVLGFLEDTSQNNKTFDNITISLKFFDESKRPILKLNSINGNGANRTIKTLRNSVRHKFNL